MALVVRLRPTGTRLGDGLLDLAGGSTDARADAVVIAWHGANANNSVLGRITMGSGTFPQSGGLVTIGTIRFGNITATTSAAVPEPASAVYLLVAVGGVAAWRRGRRR